MLFNSLEFALFLPIVFALYWFVCNKSIRLQNILLLSASYFFYGWWDWRFLFLIAFSSFVDFYIGKRLGTEKVPEKRKVFLWISLAVNLGFLGFFKYFNFFIESFVSAFSFFGQTLTVDRLNIILPIGISFYTFQTLSYTIDIYKKKLAPTNDLISFFAFVSFFPQLVAGPIERATNLLPQFFKSRTFTYESATNGLRQILWGLFKKVVIADNCAEVVNMIFADPTGYSGGTLFLGVLLFTIQIYGDFSGYSDIAIGTARLFGFKLMKNFDFPYFSTSTAELWRKWHMSLSQYANDYLFMSLSLYFSKYKKQAVLISLFLTFLIIGLWHGANWTFVVFGIWNGLISCVEYSTTRKRRKFIQKGPEPLLNFLGWLITFCLWMIGMLIFRSNSMTDALVYANALFSWSLFSVPSILPTMTLVFVGFMFVVEWFGRKQAYGIENILQNWYRPIRWGFFLMLILVILKFGGTEEEFIYFQF